VEVFFEVIRPPVKLVVFGVGFDAVPLVRAAKALGLKAEDVRVVCPFTGGGFGSKGATWPHAVLAAAAAHLGKPVKLVVSRQQMFTTVGHRSPAVRRVKLGAAKGGKLVAVSRAGTGTSPGTPSSSSRSL
jgi:CO/xanthine dehydrogenase Mo-binding subunit